MTTSSTTESALQAYLTHLERLPFVRSVQIQDTRSINDPNSKALLLTTPQGELRAHLGWSRSNLSQPIIEHVLSVTTSLDSPYFFFAPSIGGETAKRLEEARINYVDLAGNSWVQLGDEYVAQIEGRKLSVKAPRERALRAPSLQVLFTLLAKPELINAPVRTIASEMGRISPQTVSDLRKRLVAEEWVTAAGRTHAWTPGGRGKALDRLLADYDRLAHHLQLGRFRPRPMPLDDLEQALAERLSGQSYSFGGGAGLQRRDGLYRGTRTIVYVEETIPSVSGLLVPDERGEVIFARFPGDCARDEKQELSPLLIYLDLMTEGEPRAREVAGELRTMIFEEDNES